jgi:hypothetical protein
MIPVQHILEIQDSATGTPLLHIPPPNTEVSAASCGCGKVRRSYYASTISSDPNIVMYTNNKHFYNILHVAVMAFSLKMTRRALQAGADVHSYYYVDRLDDRRANTLGKIIIDNLNYQPPKLVADIIALLVEHGYSLDEDRWKVYPDDDEDDEGGQNRPYLMDSLREDILGALNSTNPEHAKYMASVVLCLEADHNITI